MTREPDDPDEDKPDPRDDVLLNLPLQRDMFTMAMGIVIALLLVLWALGVF